MSAASGRAAAWSSSAGLVPLDDASQQIVSHSASATPPSDAEKNRAFRREVDFNLRRRFPARKSLELALASHPPTDDVRRYVQIAMDSNGADLDNFIVPLSAYLFEHHRMAFPPPPMAAPATTSYVQVATDPRYTRTDFQMSLILHKELSAGATIFPTVISFTKDLQSPRRLTPSLLATINGAKARLLDGYSLKDAEDELHTALNAHLKQFGGPEVERVHPRRSNTIFLSAVDSAVALIGQDRLEEAVELYLQTRPPQESLARQIHHTRFATQFRPEDRTNRIIRALNNARAVSARGFQQSAASAQSASAAAASASSFLLPPHEMVRAPVAAAAAPSNPPAQRPASSVYPQPPAPILSRTQQQQPHVRQQQPPLPRPQVDHPMDIDPPSVAHAGRPAVPAAASGQAMVVEAPPVRMQTCAHNCGCIDERSYSSTLHENPIAVDSEEVEEHQCYGTLHPRCTSQCPGHSLLYNPRFNVTKNGWTSYPLEWIYLWMMDYEELRPKVDWAGLPRSYLLKIAKDVALPLPGSEDMPTTMIEFLDTQEA